DLAQVVLPLLVLPLAAGPRLPGHPGAVRALAVPVRRAEREVAEPLLGVGVEHAVPGGVDRALVAGDHDRAGAAEALAGVVGEEQPPDRRVRPRLRRRI